MADVRILPLRQADPDWRNSTMSDFTTTFAIDDDLSSLFDSLHSAGPAADIIELHKGGEG
jgi:hypothetical protein